MEIDKNIRLKIIIVDVSPDDHFFIKTSMKEFKNITFTSFYEGDSFLKYLSERQPGDGDALPDIVILDINMPRLTGFEIFEIIKEHTISKHISFFILTTNLTESDLHQCRRLHLSCHKKPFSTGDFKILLEQLIVDAKK